LLGILSSWLLGEVFVVFLWDIKCKGMLWLFSQVLTLLPRKITCLLYDFSPEVVYYCNLIPHKYEWSDLPLMNLVMINRLYEKNLRFLLWGVKSPLRYEQYFFFWFTWGVRASLRTPRLFSTAHWISCKPRSR